MKTTKNIFNKVIDFDNLKLAHYNARKDKGFYQDVKMVDKNPEFYLRQIQKMLVNKTYKVSKYKVKLINDKGKERELFKLPYFPDRIIQWALMLQLESVFSKVFTNFSCASVKQKGITHARKLVRKYLKDKHNTRYCLKLDIKKFYPSIDKAILKKLLRKKIACKDTLYLLDLIIDSFPKDKGVPIGSYLSQYLANFYLTYFDHYLKEVLKIKYVVRYMDDIVIFSSNKAILHEYLQNIKDYLDANLNLEVKENHQVFPTNIRGVDFVGFRFFYDFTLLRKNTAKRLKKAMNKIRDRPMLNLHEFCKINSYTGWLKWCNSFRIFSKYIQIHFDKLKRFYLLNFRKNPQKYIAKLLYMKGAIL